jgi:ATP-dependent exoDNAse (exonuclease V) beta subunit
MNSNELESGYNHQKLLENYRLVEEDSVIRGPEWQFFLKFVEDHPEMKPFRTEWMIYHEDVKLAGSIDMVYENPDGTLSIYDWKRAKEIIKDNTWNKYALNPIIRSMPDTNFWHYSLQLNTYKHILETKYNKIVTNLCLVRIHPDNPEQTYELLPVPILTKEMDELFDELKKKNN